MKKVRADCRVLPVLVSATVLFVCLLAACDRPASKSNWSPITNSYQTVTAEALASLGVTATAQPTVAPTTTAVQTTAPAATIDASKYPDQLPHSLKGYDLYSWQVDEEWNFTLITGTNRSKSFDEIIAPGDTISDDGFVKITVSGMEALKAVLTLLPTGEEILWSGMDLGGEVPTGTVYLTLPPQEMIDDLTAYCDSLGLKLTAIIP
jgi:hypothetical protein